MTDPGNTLQQAVHGVRQAGLDPDSPGGAVALKHLLRVEDPGSGPLTHHKSPAAAPTGDDQNSTTPDARVAAWVGVEPDRVRDVVEFTEDGVLLRLPSARLARAKADRQRVITLIKLALDRVGYGVDEVPASHVNAACHEYACADQNLPHNVAARGDLVTRRGKRGSYVYRASQPGMERARELLVQLFNDETALRV